MSQYNDLLTNIPVNKGYIVKNIKYMGIQKQLDTVKEVKLIDDDQRHIHRWSRTCFTRKLLNNRETDYDGWNTVGKRRCLVECRSMNPCPEEMKNHGYCSRIYDPKHRKFFYHFSSIKNRIPIINTSGKVLCKYSGDRICWEINNGEHNKFFYHE